MSLLLLQHVCESALLSAPQRAPPPAHPTPFIGATFEYHSCRMPADMPPALQSLEMTLAAAFKSSDSGKLSTPYICEGL